MELIIRGDNDAYRRRIELICNLFLGKNDMLLFTSKHINCFKTDQIVVNIEYIYNDGEVKVNSQGNFNEKKYCFSFKCKLDESVNSETKKLVGKGISIVLLKTLEEITGKKQGWGILTGIRPIKLYHKLYRETMSHKLVQRNLLDNYLLKLDKILLMEQIVDRQIDIIPDLYKKPRELSIYIGIPFCPTKCAYCTFPSHAINKQDKSIDRFLQALLIEIDLIGGWLNESGIKVKTIYFGGGTPTSIEAEEIDRIFLQLSKYIDLTLVKEITIEAGRPDTITEHKLNIISKWRVDRISINPQTFTQKTLDIIGRNHAVSQVEEKYILAREKGIKNINMDLIIGLPEERIKDIENSLFNIGILKPELHAMAYKTASKLVKNRSDYTITDREEIINMMEYARNWAKEHQYYPYYLYRQKNILGNLENIGYSKLGKECLYNILMMEERQTIVALGCGAVSKLISQNNEQVIRLPNPKDWKTYTKNVEKLSINKIAKLEEVF